MDMGTQADGATTSPQDKGCALLEKSKQGGVSTQSTWGVQGEGDWLEAPKCRSRGAGSANGARGRACRTGQDRAYAAHVCQAPGALQGQHELPPLGGAIWLP